MTLDERIEIAEKYKELQREDMYAGVHSPDSIIEQCHKLKALGKEWGGTRST